MPGPAPVTMAAGAPLVRSITLRDLGLDKGIDFLTFTGYKELYFPIPHQGYQTATLRLVLRAGAAFEGQRHMQILAGNRVVASRAMTGDFSKPIELPIDPSYAEDGFLRITLRYSGALTTDRCFGERVAGDFLSVRPETALELRLSTDALADVRSVASLLPHDVLLVLPERDLDRGEIAAVLRAAAVLRHKGAEVTLASPASLPAGAAGVWSRGVVMVGKPEDFPQVAKGVTSTDGIVVIPTPAGPALLVGGGENAATALPLLNTRWLPLADASELAVTMLSEGAKGKRTLSLEELGLALQSGVLDEQVQFDMPFASDQLPRGTTVDGVRLDLAVGTGNEDISIFAFLNGRLLGGRGATGAVPTSLSVAVPDGLVGRDNTLSVRLQRPPLPGACVKPAPGQPVQLLPSSALELGNSSEAPTEFFQLPQVLRGGADIVLPAEPARLRDALTHLIAVGIDLLPDDAPITVRLEPRPTVGERSFIVVSRIEPADTDPRLRFDRGTLAITRSDGKLLVDLANNNASVPTVAQVVRTPHGGGLWLRPGKSLPETGAGPVRLDRGDIAVIDKAGIALAFSTDRKQAATVVYQDIRTWQDLASEYRPWIVATVWLVIAVLFAGALSRTYRRKGTR